MKTCIKQTVFLFLSFFAMALNINEVKASKNLKTKTNLTLVIAKVKNGVTSFVVNQNTLKKDWQKFISTKHASKPCVLNNPKIVSNKKGDKFYLTVTGIVDTLAMKFTIELKRVGTNCLVLVGLTTQCAISNDNKLEVGCIPKDLACTPCNNKSDCEKTVTDSPFAIFPSLTPSICE